MSSVFLCNWVWCRIWFNVDVVCIFLLMFIAFACVYWLLMNLRFVQWVYLWEKLCERIRDLCLSFEKILLKISIIWTCDCTCVASDDAYASVICFWWCMLLMHESIVGKETETTDFFWRVLLSNYLVFDCCWFWVGCHVGRIKARARFWSISLWNPKMDVVIWCCC